jgi:hypothetical protein
MKLSAEDFHSIRRALANIPAEISSDAVGANAAKTEEIFPPETHSAALDPTISIVIGSRGTGKSFWAGVLGQKDTRDLASRSFPRLGLDQYEVGFGFTGLNGPGQIGVDAVNACLRDGEVLEHAKAFWWATILRAASLAVGSIEQKMGVYKALAADWENRNERLAELERQVQDSGKKLLIVYDALDRMATDWPRRRLLTEALLEVAWEMRAFRFIRVKLFFRPDQLEDESLRFVELPKLKSGAVRLDWSQTDLYGMVYSRLALTTDGPAAEAFGKLLGRRGLKLGDQHEIITRKWPLISDRKAQEQIMADMAGPFMGSGTYGFKKGKTYDWAFKHLSDAFSEVTPRSFLGLLIGAARYGLAPSDRVITAEGIRHGLRAASKTRVDQLHQDFPWIKGVLAPLAGLLLPQDESAVFAAWKYARTIATLLEDAKLKGYLPPFPPKDKPGGKDLYLSLERIGVMERRKDDRIDMPDVFRVAAKLLKKGATAPLR